MDDGIGTDDARSADDASSAGEGIGVNDGATGSRLTGIQDEAEVDRWFAAGMTDRWICEEYERRYNITTAPAFWLGRRRRARPALGAAAETDLVPWVVGREHQWAYPLLMLRMEARRRAGEELAPHNRARLAAFTEHMEDADLVIAYDPPSVEGFTYVARRHGIDTDWFRVPD